MADTDNPDKPERDEKGRMLPGHVGRGGRRRKQFTEDVEEFAIDALSLQGVRMIVQAMTSATKLSGKEGVEHPDWPARIHAFEVLRDTFMGKPPQAIVDGDGKSLSFGVVMLPQEAKE
jgi:hypothetical protein